MTRFDSLVKISCGLLFLFLISGNAGFAFEEASSPSLAQPSNTPRSCEDFANRQIRIAERQLQGSNYSRALKVLNRTAENCDIEPVRKKIVEVLNGWYGEIQGQGPDALQRFLGVLTNQTYVNPDTKSQFKRRIGTRIRALIEQEFQGGNFQEAYALCRKNTDFVADNFESRYYCGSSAEEIGVSSVVMESYRWLIQNWRDDQSLTTWSEIASPLEDLYFLNGRFQAAYRLARRRARRDPSPEAILSSLVSIRGQFLSPVLQAGAIFYGNQPSQSALSHVGDEMQRVNFPEYVSAFYILASDGSVERGMYGQEANQPSSSLLQKATGPVSLLKSTENSTQAWLVSSLDERFLVLEFGIATTPEENARLETVYENIENDDKWNQLYDLESTETTPATGSAVGTLLSGASLDGQDLASYDRIFDASPLLAYYCIQNGNGGIDQSHNFDQDNLAYGDEEWDRTSTTPALYHHVIQYSGQSVREVLWPKFVDEEWVGIVRVGLRPS